MVALAAAGAIWLAGPPRPLPPDAAADRFAAGRAMADVRQLARAPRPVGSAAHRAAREYLLGRMSELGLTPEVHETTVVRQDGEDGVRAALVRNLVGRLSGRGPGGAVLLVAHYDSRPNTPGAGDDASGVATVLEAVRALAQGPPLERDLIVLLADAEELGMLGARGFAAEHPWMEDVELVLNFEARGSRGPAAMFETGAGDLELVRAFARAAPYPLATSVSAEVYARMPNDTDFTPFRAAGLSGLNFAFLGGLNAYHHALDTPGRLEAASLQQTGANAVALIRSLDGRAPPDRGGDGIWFNALGAWLLVLPAAVAVPVAVGLTVLLLATAALGLRRHRVGWRGLRSGSLLCVASLLLAPLAAAALWRLFADNAGTVLDTPHGLPHRLELTGLGLFLIALAAVALPAGLVRRLSPTEVALGVGLIWALLALLSAALLPGVSFLFWWPLWGLVVAALVVVIAEPPRSVAVLVLSAGALPGVALLAPLAGLVFQAMTPRLAVAAMAPAALLIALAMPALLAAAGERLRLSGAALLASLAVLAASVWGAPDARRPRTVDLVHLEELDSGVGYWISRDRQPLHPWIAERLGGEPQEWQTPASLGFAEQPVLRGPGGPVEASGPEATEVEDLRLEGRRLTARVRSPQGAPMLLVEALASVELVAVELAGERVELDGRDPTHQLRLELAGFPPEGLEICFQLSDRWPVELHLTELFYGLPGEPPPPELIPSGSWTSHSRLVHRSFLR